jgi:flagellar basal body rod protein FlgG
MAKQYAQITVRPILYEKDTNGEYVLDTNGNKIVIEDDYLKITSTDDYDTVTTIVEFFE